MASKREKNQFAGYFDLVNGRDQVTQWLVWDDGFRAWAKTFTLPAKNQIHHIFGRGKTNGHSGWFNLLMVSAASHAWGHDQHPAQYELACLRAKMAQWHTAHATIRDEIWDSYKMAVLIGRVSMSGRISELMAKVPENSIFATYGKEMTDWLRGE